MPTFNHTRWGEAIGGRAERGALVAGSVGGAMGLAKTSILSNFPLARNIGEINSRSFAYECELLRIEVLE